jgi:ATP-dependent helicase HrpB
MCDAPLAMNDLPIFAVLPALLEALRAGSNAVLVAPPGAGKTTAVAPALLAEAWCTGEILLLSPRRLAARAAAERMAELAGERVGGTIGYATRLDSRRSAATRLTVVTEGIFLKRIQSDPELAGVSAVLFDEVHERSLDSDFALALALDSQAALRPDLRLLAMSATLDGARFSNLMDGAPVIASEGRSHPSKSSTWAAARSSGSRMRRPRPCAGRSARRRAECSPSCPAWRRSSERRSGWPCRKASTSTGCTAVWSPASSAPRSRLREPGGARSCWRLPSRRPA